MRFWIHISRVWLGMLAASLAMAQQAPAGGRSSANSIQQPGARVAVPALREIDDRESGVRWLLVRDAAHPGGPGRLIALRSGLGGARAASSLKAAAEAPMIRGGDLVRLEEHTAITDAVLESVALGPARAGAPLTVRLKIGGRTVRAIATGPGRAVLRPNEEVRP